MSQRDIFLTGESDSWFNRNPGGTVPAGPGDPVIDALAGIQVPESGRLLDVGGSSGRLAAGFVQAHPSWEGVVLEPSGLAISAGRQAFPHLQFSQGTITDASPPDGYELVIISFVMCVVDRNLLSQAVASTDRALKDRGLLVIFDFDPAYPRANPYVHQPGLFTYKQDYAACYEALGIYHRLAHGISQVDTSADTDDPYDRSCAVTVLRKDLFGRYARP